MEIKRIPRVPKLLWIFVKQNLPDGFCFTKSKDGYGVDRGIYLKEKGWFKPKLIYINENTITSKYIQYLPIMEYLASKYEEKYNNKVTIRIYE
jgi:hypothetical protein